MTTQPNALFIISDQHNAKVLAHEGHPDVQTPHLDRLAREGTRFSNAISQNPICTPSRVSFLSGQYCHNHGYYGLSGPNPEGLPNIFGHFRKAGYRTSAVGKIHCPEYWVEDQCDQFHESTGCSIGGRSAEYRAFLDEDGKADVEEHTALWEFGPRGRQTMEGRAANVTYEQSQEGWIASKTIDFMQKSVADGKPFLAFASLPRPHQCTAPSEPFWSMYEGKQLTMPPNADWDLVGRAPHMRSTAENWRRGNWALIEPKTYEAARARKMRGYLGAISQCDHAVGQMIDCLDALGVAENTIVIYTSDHGDYACEHGIMEKAPGICSDAITRIPMIWRWPGHIPANRKSDGIIEAIDLSQSICALAELPAMVAADGENMSDLLTGKTDDGKRVGVTEFAWSKSIRKGKYRMVYYPRTMFPDQHPDGFGELFDMEADPYEMRNLYFDERFAAVRADLEKELMEWLILTVRNRTQHPPVREQGEPWSHRYHNTVSPDGRIGFHDIVKATTYRSYL